MTLYDATQWHELFVASAADAELEALRDLPDHREAAVPLGTDRVEPGRSGPQLGPDDAVLHLATDANRFDAIGAEWDRRRAVIREIAEGL